MFLKQILVVSLIIISIMHSANAQNLATMKVEATSTDNPARSLVQARNHFLISDAPPPLGGTNEAINPIEMLLGALGSCGVLVAEKAAAELGLDLKNASTEVAGSLDPRGVKGEPVDPAIQVFRMKLMLTGVTQKEADQIVAAIKSRCPVYTTLAKAAPIKLEIVLDKE